MDDKKRNNADFERCVNYLAEIIKKYGFPEKEIKNEEIEKTALVDSE